MSNKDKPADSSGTPSKRKPKRAKNSKRLSNEQVAELLTDVAFHAPNESVADICGRYGISEKTLQRWKKRVAGDPSLSTSVLQKKRDRAEGLKETRVRFLRNSIDKLGQLVQAAGVENMRDVAGAIKIVGDLDSLSHALGIDDGQQPVGDREGQVPPEVASGGGGAATGDSADPVH